MKNKNNRDKAFKIADMKIRILRWLRLKKGQ